MCFFLSEVQAGPLEYSRVFFLERYKDFDKESLTELHLALLKFIDACRAGIDKHELLCENEHDYAFQANLETGFADTKDKMDTHYKTFLENK